MSEALENAARALLEHEFDDAVEPNDWGIADEDERGAARDRARAAITAFLSEVEPEALARTWKPFAFDEADSYYPYRGQIRKSAIYDASEMLAALRKLMNPDNTKQDGEPK